MARAPPEPGGGGSWWAAEAAGASGPNRLASGGGGGGCLRVVVGTGAFCAWHHASLVGCEDDDGRVQFGGAGGAEDNVERKEDPDHWIINQRL